jgi:ankyrin repeat protein
MVRTSGASDNVSCVGQASFADGTAPHLELQIRESYAFWLQEVVKLLLANQCNVKAAAADDVNALHFAAQKGHVEVMRHLINAGGRRDRVKTLLYESSLDILHHLRP